MSKCNSETSECQQIYCGIDVHSRKWHLCVRSNGIQLKLLVMPADAGQTIDWLKSTYPGAEIHCVYEAGFSGFSAHRSFLKAGFHSMVINPADVPTTGKERTEKCDRTDCRKLARHLEDGSLTPIHVPSPAYEGLRGLVRRETQVRNAAVRLSNQLKGALYFHGRHAVPQTLGRKALLELEEAMQTEPDYAYAQEILSLIRQLRQQREERRLLVEAEHTALAKMGLAASAQLLAGIPGIAFRSAAVLLSELGDISRFGSGNKLASYVGLAPHAYGSGDGEQDRACGNRKQKQLHYLFLQAAWVAVARDSAMQACFDRQCRKNRHKKTRAILAVAKKLLLTAAAVLRHNEPYRHPEPKTAAAAPGAAHPAQEDGCLPAGGTAFMQPEHFVNGEDMLYDTPDEYL